MSKDTRRVTVVISSSESMKDDRVNEYIEANALPGDQITVIDDNGNIEYSSIYDDFNRSVSEND